MNALDGLETTSRYYPQTLEGVIGGYPVVVQYQGGWFEVGIGKKGTSCDELEVVHWGQTTLMRCEGGLEVPMIDDYTISERGRLAVNDLLCAMFGVLGVNLV